MVTILKEYNGKLYCGHCRMGVKDLCESTCCDFCGYNWTNWEQLMEKYYEEEWIDGIKSNSDDLLEKYDKKTEYEVEK